MNSLSSTSGRHVCTPVSRARLHSAPLPPPGLEGQVPLSSPHGILVKAAPVRPRLQTSTSVPSLQQHVSTTQVGTHADSSSATCKRSASTAQAGTTMPSVQIHVRDVVLFQSLGPWSCQWSVLVNPNLTGLVTLIQLTVILCLINAVSLFHNGIQDQRAGTPPISLRRPVDGFMRLFFKKPVIMFRTSLSSSLRTLATRTSPSCSTRTPLSPTLWFSPSTKPRPAKAHGAWSHSSFAAFCDALHFLEHQLSHFGQET